MDLIKHDMTECSTLLYNEELIEGVEPYIRLAITRQTLHITAQD